MPRPKRGRIARKKPQKYDTSLKDWVEQRAHDILPLLLPGAVYEKTLTVEIIRSVMRADKVFQILYCGEEHILHLEFETGFDRDLPSRLHVYNAVLYRDYHLPVITIVVYPFRVEQAISPFCIQSNKKDIVTFHFKTLPLFTLKAESFVREQRTCMYPLLPTMKGVHAELMSQVMQELKELYRDDEVSLVQQYTWMMLLLERTDTIESLEKEKIQEQFTMFDQLWDESPRIKKLKEQYRLQGHEQGREQGREQERERARREVERVQEQMRREVEQTREQTRKEIEQAREQARREVEQEARIRSEQEAKTLRRALISLVHARFPDLTAFAQQRAMLFDKPDAFDLLIQKIATAPDAKTARWLLDSSAEVQE
jgi:F0F1-type ATP synthase membrane subunit b/b'